MYITAEEETVSPTIADCKYKIYSPHLNMLEKHTGCQMSGVGGHFTAWAPSQLEISHGYRMGSWSAAKCNPGHGVTQTGFLKSNFEPHL